MSFDISKTSFQWIHSRSDKRAADPENALADLLDLDRYAGNLLAGSAPMLARNVPMKSRCWRDGDGCANEAWRMAA